jgi:hypothetical protein
LDEKLFAKLGEFKSLLESLFSRHAAEHLKVRD